MGQVAAALGEGSTLSHGGKEYTLAPWSYSVQSKFERYLADHAVQSLKQMRPHLTEAEYKDELKTLRREIAAGYYTFGTPQVAEALQAVPHLKKLLHLMLLVNHPDATPELVDGMVAEQMEEVMAKMAEANADPTTPGPTPSPAGTTTT